MTAIVTPPPRVTPHVEPYATLSSAHCCGRSGSAASSAWTAWSCSTLSTAGPGRPTRASVCAVAASAPRRTSKWPSAERTKAQRLAVASSAGAAGVPRTTTPARTTAAPTTRCHFFQPPQRIGWPSAHSVADSSHKRGPERRCVAPGGSDPELTQQRRDETGLTEVVRDHDGDRSGREGSYEAVPGNHRIRGHEESRAAGRE